MKGRDSARWLEILVNIAILAVCAMLLLQGWNKFRVRSPAATALAQPGTRLAVDGMNWADSKRTLVLALQPRCHFCAESIPFHRRLITQARARSLRVVALMSGPDSDSRAYLANAGLDVHEIRTMATTGPVFGTPSIALVDAEGTITKLWAGKLSANSEQQVLTQIGVDEER